MCNSLYCSVYLPNSYNPYLSSLKTPGRDPETMPREPDPECTLERQTAAGRVAALAVASRIPNVASSIAALRTKVRTTVHTRAQHFTRGRRTDLDYSQRRPAVALYLVRVRVSGQSYQGQDQGLRPRCALAPYRQGARSSRRARHVRHR